MMSEVSSRVLLLAMTLCSPCIAGITIHYDGKVASTDAIAGVVSTATNFAALHGWKWAITKTNRVTITRVVDEKDQEYVGPLSGVVLYPHDMCEPVHIEFGADLVIQDFVKTQFAGPDVHISVIELLREIKGRCKELVVYDESEYWETSDREKLEKQLKAVNDLVDKIKKEKPSSHGPLKLKSGRIADIVQ